MLKGKPIEEYEYFKSLMEPEKHKGGRIPFGHVASSTFQLKKTCRLEPNNLGNMLVFLNPQFLATQDACGGVQIPTPGGKWIYLTYTTSLWQYASADLTGVDDRFSGVYEPINIGQTIPSFYTKYRLVSASLDVKYIGDLCSSQGLICGCILPIRQKNLGGGYYIIDRQTEPFNPNHTYSWMENLEFRQYEIFNLIRNGMYSRENNILEGMRLLYFPMDNKSLCFRDFFVGKGVKLSDIEGGSAADHYTFSLEKNDFGNFMWAFFTQNMPSDIHYSLQIEVTCNYECLPKADFSPYTCVELNNTYLTEQETMLIIKYFKDKLNKLIKK